MEQFLAKFKRNNLEASLKEAEEAFKVDKKEKSSNQYSCSNNVDPPKRNTIKNKKQNFLNINIFDELQKMNNESCLTRWYSQQGSV